MELMPLNIPPGIYKNGTRYQSKGRYFDASLVRWYNGVLRPIGGWERYEIADTETPLPPLVADPTTEFVRDCHAWRDSEGKRHYLFGSNKALYHMDDTGTVTDVTPAEIVSAQANAATLLTQRTTQSGLNDGYGMGLYGAETYGTPRTIDNIDPNPEPAPPPAPPSGPPPVTTTSGRWKFDDWGENVICFADWTGRLYEFTPPTGGASVSAAERIPNAPVDLIDFIVSDDYIVIGIGSSTDLRRVRTSDRQNNNLWAPADDNYCIDRLISGNGAFISITKTGSRFIILSETDCHVGNFVGLPYVYAIERISVNCAPINKQAVIPFNIGAAWFGVKDFFVFDGNSVNIVPCDVLDYLYNNVVSNSYITMVGYNNSDYQELWWLYATEPDGQPDEYVIWSWADSHWNIGKLERMAALENGVLTNPIMVDHESKVYFHEIDNVLPDGEMYAKTGPIEIKDGDIISYISQIIPDANTFGAFSITIEGRMYPTGDDPVSYGPYEYANPMNVRATGRELMFTISGGDQFWQYGNQRIRIEYQTGSKR